MAKQDKSVEKVYVISHTHWDREWYNNFQSFRTRLVYMMDELIDHMEKDPAYRFFTLDGQTIVLDDYLEIRPENSGRLKELIQSGKIAIGPWYVMPDEFLVSGESLIRNLLKGIRQARSWGVEPMKTGYVTDIFGHNSQFPQILRGFGIDNAILFRGFYGDAEPSEFIWEGTDGSRILGLKMDEDRGYGDFYFALRWPFFDRDFAYEEHMEDLLERAKKFIQYKTERATTKLCLVMDGIDHIEIEPQLPWMLNTFNKSDMGVQFIHTNLETYVKDFSEQVSRLKVHKGEQKALGYNGMSNWVPENTLSSRVHLKQNNGHCEVLLEKWAEPLGVITELEGRPYPRGFLSKAWEYLLQNHPHDSICGCSIDQVHKDMIYRFDQSRSISELMIKEQMQFISNHLNPDLLNGNQAFTVFNSSQFVIEGVIEAEIELPVNTDAAITFRELKGTSFRIYDENHQEIPYQLLEIKTNSENIYRPYREIGRVDKVDRFLVAFNAKVPSFGYATYTLEKFTIESHGPLEYNAPKLVAPVRYPGTMQVDENCWDNGRIQLKVCSNGTIDLTDKQTGNSYKGLLMIEDEADIGDGWSHVAPCKNETVRSIGSQATISIVFDGRFMARIRMQIGIKVPKSINSGGTCRSEEFIEIPVTTFIDLKKDDPMIYCNTTVKNSARDHRMRMLFPVGLEAEHYYTSTPFDLIKRDIRQPDYSGYLRKAFEVVPHNGIVAVDDGRNGLAVYSKGLYEVSVRDNKQQTVAMTLFRSTRKEIGTDGGDGGQMLRELNFSYAIKPFAVEESHPVSLWKDHVQFVTGVRSINRKPGKVLLQAPHKRKADLPLKNTYLSIDTEKLVVSSFKASEDEGNSYILRLFNVTDAEVQGTLGFNHRILSAVMVNLDEQPLSELTVLSNTVEIKVKPKQIVTVKITV